MKMFLPFACSVCFGNPHSPLSKGAIAGVIFLGAVVTTVLCGIVMTGFVWQKRARQLKQSF